MIHKIPPAAVLVAIAIVLAGVGGAAAQTVGPDEASVPDGRPGGTVVPQLALTRDQETAIYNAVSNERVKPPAADVPLAIGAPVSQHVKLPDLPAQVSPQVGPTVEGGGVVLKYAMLAREVIVVDSVRMRVVAIIHGRPHP
jgi:hypothetical protein